MKLISKVLATATVLAFVVPAAFAQMAPMAKPMMKKPMMGKKHMMMKKPMMKKHMMGKKGMMMHKPMMKPMMKPMPMAPKPM